jgi:DNA-binding NtrC family response regulator
VPLDIRLVASTNVDLTQAVAAGDFRVDLFYRLNVAAVELVPLRARRGDILPLAEHFIGLHTSRLSLQRPALSPEARHALLTYDWPGNIRELENVIHVALLVSGGEVIRPQDLRLASIRPPVSSPSSAATPFEIITAQLDQLFAAPPPGLHERLEKLIVTRAFSHTDQNQVRTAKLLGVSRNILRTLLKRYGLIRGRLTAASRPLPRPPQLSSSGNAHRGVESYP